MMALRGKSSSAAQQILDAALDRVMDAYGSSRDAARSATRATGSAARDGADFVTDHAAVAADEVIDIARRSAGVARRHPFITAGLAIAAGAAVALVIREANARKERADISDEYQEGFD